MNEPKYYIESEKHYNILDNLLHISVGTKEDCEWTVSYVEKMLGDSAFNLGLSIVKVTE